MSLDLVLTVGVLAVVFAALIMDIRTEEGEEGGTRRG